MKLSFLQPVSHFVSNILVKYGFSPASKNGRLVNAGPVADDSDAQNAVLPEKSLTERVDDRKKVSTEIVRCLACLVVALYMVLVVVVLVPLAIAGYGWVLAAVHGLVYPPIGKMLDYCFPALGKQIIRGDSPSV